MLLLYCYFLGVQNLLKLFYSIKINEVINQNKRVAELSKTYYLGVAIVGLEGGKKRLIEAEISDPKNYGF